MLRIFFCAMGLFAGLLPKVSSAESSVQNDQVLSTVYSEFYSASDTLPDVSVASVIVIDAEKFPTDALTAADVVELSPSVQIQQTGELGSLVSVSVRGAPSQQTQVYVDGILQSGVGGEGGYLQQIPLSDVERIEVYAGSLPGSFSQATPGGAINIVRKKQIGRRLKITTGVGSFGQRRYAALGEWRAGNWQWSGFAERLKSDNNFEYLKENGTPDYPDDDAVEQRNHAAFNSTQGSAKVAFEADDVALHITLDAYDSHKELPHWNNLDTVHAFYDKQVLTATAGYSRNQWLRGIDTSLRWQGQQQQGHFNDPEGDVSVFGTESFDDLTSQQLQHHSVLSGDNALYTLNTEWHQDRFSLRSGSHGNTLDAQRIQFNSGLGSEWFVNNHLTLASTARHVWWQDEQQSEKTKQQDWGAQFGLRFEKDRGRWQINGQRSTRQPTLVERFGNQGAFVGNADLVSEQAWSVDSTVAWSAEHWQWQSDVFFRHSTHAIAPVYNSQGIGRYINLDQALFAGTEWLGAWQLGSVSLQTRGALQQGVARSSLAVYDARQVPGFYPISTTQQMTWSPSNQWAVTVSYLYERGLYYDRANSTLAPEKHQLDAGVQWYRPPFRFSLDLQNLTDRAHLDYSRKALPGRSAVFTAQYFLGDSP